MVFGDVNIPIPCPKCGKEIKEKLGRLQNNPQLRCPGCGASIHVDGHKLREVTKAGEDLKKALGKLGGTIKIKL